MTTTDRSEWRDDDARGSKTMSATGEAPRRKKGGAERRPCACGCGVCTREFGIELTVRRTQVGDRDLLGPLLDGMSEGKRQKIRKALAQGKSGGHISLVHVHPDDLFWTDSLRSALHLLVRPSFRFFRFHFLSYNSPISRFCPSGDASYGERLRPVTLFIVF